MPSLLASTLCWCRYWANGDADEEAEFPLEPVKSLLKLEGHTGCVYAEARVRMSSVISVCSSASRLRQFSSSGLKRNFSEANIQVIQTSKHPFSAKPFSLREFLLFASKEYICVQRVHIWNERKGCGTGLPRSPHCLLLWGGGGVWGPSPPPFTSALATDVLWYPLLISVVGWNFQLECLPPCLVEGGGSSPFSEFSESPCTVGRGSGGRLR